MSVCTRKGLRPTDRLFGHRLVFLVGLCVEAHAEMAATLQVASACFSGSPPNLVPFVGSKDKQIWFINYTLIIIICLSVQNLLSSILLTSNLKFKIYRTIILPVVLYRWETWSLTLREERRLQVFENRVLRSIFGPKRDEVTGEWRKLFIMRSWMISTPHPVLFGWSNREDWDGRSM